MVHLNQESTVFRYSVSRTLSFGLMNLYISEKILVSASPDVPIILTAIIFVRFRNSVHKQHRAYKLDRHRALSEARQRAPSNACWSSGCVLGVTGFSPSRYFLPLSTEEHRILRDTSELVADAVLVLKSRRLTATRLERSSNAHWLRCH